MRVAVTGASGFIGSALCRFLEDEGHSVARIVRKSPGPADISWKPEAGRIEAEKLEGLDAVVHLAGENVAAGRWDARRKAAILVSRTASTTLLSETLAKLTRKPRVLVSASALGYYGERPGAVDEGSSQGEGFLAEVCRKWEAASVPASEAGIRVVNLRIGMVLSPAGGALRKMLPPFRLGLGACMGDGSGAMNWVCMDDLIRAALFCLETESVAGPVNATSPKPVTNLEFSRTLGRVLHRPALFSIPVPMIKLLFGEMGEELFLGRPMARPSKLLEAGFEFYCPDLEPALRWLLG
ncbi:MAG: TIGR01777 family oxidoreductase [Elusimicrobiota bacterium]